MANSGTRSTAYGLIVLLTTAIFVLEAFLITLWGRLSAWTLSLVALTLILMGVGYLQKRNIWGVLIDERNRMSLSRFQILLWQRVIPASRH